VAYFCPPVYRPGRSTSVNGFFDACRGLVHDGLAYSSSENLRLTYAVRRIDVRSHTIAIAHGLRG